MINDVMIKVILKMFLWWCDMLKVVENGVNFYWFSREV